jgi:hypothetical protein
MKYKYVVGIDPGLSGAIALLDIDGKLLKFTKMKTVKFISNGKKVSRIDLVWLMKLLSKLPKEETIVVFEDLMAVFVPGTSPAKVNFSLGTSIAIIESALILTGLPFERISYKSWQPYYFGNTKHQKEKSMIKTHELFPVTRSVLTAKAHYDICEAILVAELQRRILHGTIPHTYLQSPGHQKDRKRLPKKRIQASPARAKKRRQGKTVVQKVRARNKQTAA